MNGEKQIPGKLRKQPYDYEVGGKVEDFQTSEKRDYVRMNPTKAYPNKELKEWKRHVVLEKPEITVVLDEVKANPGSEIQVRFHPGVNFEKKNDFVFLRGEKGNMAVIPVVEQPFEIVPGKHAMQYVNATKDFFWIDYFDTVFKSQSEITIVATIILPVANLQEAQKIAGSKKMTSDKSGKISVSFSQNGKKYLYEFENGKDGLQIKN